MARREMVVLGLTGSIGMGKSAAAERLRRLGVPVHDADAEIHRLLREDRLHFSGWRCVSRRDRRQPTAPNSGVARFTRRAARTEPDHPRAAGGGRLPALRRARVVVALRSPAVRNRRRKRDAVIVVSAPGFVQSARVLHRPGMSAQRLAAILARQTPDALKQRQADFVVPTGLDRRMGLLALARAVTLVRQRRRRRRQVGGVRGHA
jgi:dephospho-CoA kinase